MFVVRIEMKIRSEARSELRDYAASEGLGARAHVGCRDYSFCEDLTYPQRILLVEEWATRGDFEAYKASPFFASTGARLRRMLAAPPKSAYYESDDLFAACAVE